MFVCVVLVFFLKKFQRTVGEGVVKWLFVAFLALKDTLVKKCIGKVVFINIKYKNSIILANKCQFVCDTFVFIWEVLKSICAWLFKLQLWLSN